MKRASYREAVQWIADNDEPEDRDVEAIAGYVSTLLIADLFDVEPERIARDVAKYRARKPPREPAAQDWFAVEVAARRPK